MYNIISNDGLRLLYNGCSPFFQCFVISPVVVDHKIAMNCCNVV